MNKEILSKPKTISEYYMLGPKIELIWTEELIKKYLSRKTRDKMVVIHVDILCPKMKLNCLP